MGRVIWGRYKGNNGLALLVMFLVTGIHPVADANHQPLLVHSRDKAAASERTATRGVDGG